MKNLISALLCDHIEKSVSYKSGKINNITTKLEKPIEIWNKIILHRKLMIDSLDISVIDPVKKDTYSFNNLSDDEKAIIYYIAHVQLADPNSYIIIDEPENHLHLTISKKLWDLLEVERKDCKFVYITHDLSFAASRSNKTLLWNKKFTPPANWEVETLPKHNEISESLMMEIVGVRHKILFCEGDQQNSFDYKVYSALFPELTVIPVGGHLDVISTTRAYNKSLKSYGQEASGIIDGDYHTPEQIAKWKKENVFVLPYNEIENFLC